MSFHWLGSAASSYAHDSEVIAYARRNLEFPATERRTEHTTTTSTNTTVRSVGSMRFHLRQDLEPCAAVISTISLFARSPVGGTVGRGYPAGGRHVYGRGFSIGSPHNWRTLFLVPRISGWLIVQSLVLMKGTVWG